MTNIPAIKFPQSPFVGRDGYISREWRQWLLNPQFLTLNLGTVLSIESGGTGLGTSPSSGQLLIGDNGAYALSNLSPGTSIQIIEGPGTITIAVSHIDAAQIDSGTLPDARMPALSGDISSAVNTTLTTLATVNASPGAYGDASHVATYTVDAKGRLTLSGNVAISIANTAVTGLGTLSTQNANAAAITGGTIDGATIGGITPAPVTATTFGCNSKTAQTSAAVNAAIAGTAGVLYTATEQGLINSLLALVNQLRAALVANGITV